MSIQSQITRIKNNVQSALAIIREVGITVAGSANSDSLPELVDELAYSNIDGGSFTETAAGTVDGGSFTAADGTATDCGGFTD